MEVLRRSFRFGSGIGLPAPDSWPKGRELWVNAKEHLGSWPKMDYGSGETFQVLSKEISSFNFLSGYLRRNLEGLGD